MNDNHNNELTGFLFSLLYLLKDAEKGGFNKTSHALLRTLNTFVQEGCEQLEDKNAIAEFMKIINLCMESLNLEPKELETLANQLQRPYAN